MAGTVQEEVGMRGGGPAVARFRPDLMLAVAGTLSGGPPGYSERDCPQRIGGGPSVKFFDWDAVYGLTGNNVPRKLTNRMIAVAYTHGIRIQREVITGGGTDAWSASTKGEGVLAGGLCIPTRNMHSAVGLVDIYDLYDCADYLVHFLEDYKTLD
jgi:endoglucanase